ncbi:MAG: hypothetical protein COT00_01945 [Candidatus Omnitrophica bacterium CG07_land_8_20_14_0_80_50_8]|nr:MAG: hypothetical protein COT00_01945 [Candidatus Omnitrophica bacterium CG07_land_8_20_14_0_80_50_8]
MTPPPVYNDRRAIGRIRGQISGGVMKSLLFKIGVLLTAALVVFYQPSLYAEDGSVAADNASPTDSSSAEKAPAADAAADENSSVAPQGSFTSFSGSGVPADQQIQPGSLGLNEKVSLDLRNIEVSDAIRFVAQKGGLNLAVSKNVSGRVQLLLNDVPVGDILDIILITNQLAYEKRGDIYYIMTETEFKERFGRKFSDTRKIKVFRLKYAIPDQAFALFEILKSEIGRLLVDPESGTVLVMDAQENIDRMQSALDGLEQKRSIKVYSLKYAKALDVETRLKAQLDNKKVGLISADERTNQVIVETLSERMEDIDNLVRLLDAKTKEVLIDAKIIKITMTNDLHTEIKWEGLEGKLTQYGNMFWSNHPFSPVARAGQSFVENFTTIAPTANPPAGSKNALTENLFLGLVDGNNSFEVLINFLRTLGEAKLLSNPKLAVVNNQEAKIHVGQKQAYVTTTTTTGSNTTTTAEAVTFVDVGIQLAVTPTINDDGFVTMKIKPEVSSVVDTLTTPSGNKIPIIDSSLAETSVMVKDGVSIIIGGLRRDEDVVTRKKIPILGDLPLLGAPFNSTTSKKSHTELLILITPHIVYGDDVMTGERKAADRPYMTYSDYGAVNPGGGKDTVVKTPPVVHS